MDEHLYRNGNWTTMEDPFEDGVIEDQLVTMGFEPHFVIGDPGVTMSVEVWKRAEETPHYYLSLSDAARVENVFAEELPDMLELLARWAPIVQAGIIADVLDDLKDEQAGPDGLAETIARKLNE